MFAPGLNDHVLLGEPSHGDFRLTFGPRRIQRRSSYSALMFATRITLPHFSASSAMSLPKSAGEPPSTMAPRSAYRAFRLGSARAALISLLRPPTITGGARLLAPPLQ